MTVNILLCFAATFAVQELIATVERDRVRLTCIFMLGSPASGCYIELIHATSGKKEAVSIYKSITSSATLNAPQNGSYNVSVYDIDAKGTLITEEAVSKVIWVGFVDITPSRPTGTNVIKWTFC